jgi:hypothetical protein
MKQKNRCNSSFPIDQLLDAMMTPCELQHRNSAEAIQENNSDSQFPPKSADLRKMQAALIDYLNSRTSSEIAYLLKMLSCFCEKLIAIHTGGSASQLPTHL